MRGRDVRATARRVRIARVLLFLPFLVLTARAAHLSVVDRRGAERGAAQTQRVLTLMPERGTIVDRNGTELAISVKAPSVYATPSAMGDLDTAASKLARALGRDPRRVAARLRAHPSFVFVARWADPESAERVRALGLPGVGILDEPRRFYPHRTLAAPVVGFANIDGIGVRGVEQQEDAWLRGTARRIPVQRDARGRLLAEGGAWSTAGGDVALTLDAPLQADALAHLSEAVEKTGARGGLVISMDPHSGDILSLAEYPSFDPNGFRHLDYVSTRSRAFLDAVEPGSIMKIFLVSAALERGAVRAEQRFDCEDGAYRIPGKVIRDEHCESEIDVPGILRRSSNIGAVKIAQALGPREHFEMLRRFGFGGTSQSGFPEESAGVLRRWEEWRPLDHATIAFGQGMGATPIQMVAATAALARGGQRVHPRLVAARRAAGGAWQPTGRRLGDRIVSPATARAVLEMLEGVVGPEGTGRKAGLAGVRVAGKTGTAQKWDPEAGTYSSRDFIAWFVGIVPADDPRLVILVGLDEPRRPFHTGGATAAPVFAKVAAAQLARFGILTTPQPVAPPPVPTRVVRTEPEPPRPSAPAPPPAPKKPAVEPPQVPPAAVPALARLNDKLLLPDLRGLTVAEVRQITASTALDVEISGRGRAVSQSPPPGTVVAVENARVVLRFESKTTGAGEG